MGDVIQKKYLEIFEASYMMPGARVSLANNTYRVSSKTVPTRLIAHLSASTHAKCNSSDVFERFMKLATR